ncbi:MAG: hypothetical protein EBR82_67330 [Caulobacteraceae bacterium]|nr:hypothetical protein [Caulobacteraceae bacterium]
MSDYSLVEWVDPPIFNPKRERCIIGQPVQENDVWKTHWEIILIPDSEEATKVRAQRTQLLKDSDWTQVADAPVDKTAWAAYRQALRDVPSQGGFPWDIQWPVKP